MTSPTRLRRNRNRTGTSAAGTAESVQTACASTTAGGQGARLQTADVRTAGDTQLIRQAVREGWPVPFEMRRQIVEHVVDVALNDEHARTSTSCMRLLVALSVANVQIELEEYNA